MIYRTIKMKTTLMTRRKKMKRKMWPRRPPQVRARSVPSSSRASKSISAASTASHSSLWLLPPAPHQRSSFTTGCGKSSYHFPRCGA